MSADIIIDLHADFAAACARELRAAGYVPPVGPAAEIIRCYTNVRNRRVPQRPRNVHKASYAVPAHLAAGEQAFLAAVAAGADLRPYQSTKLDKADFDDGMLSDFGIQHFHPGTGPHAIKPGFVARTEPVLFALVRDDDFYCLGCYEHGPSAHNAWSKTSVLDLLHETWPDVIAFSSLNRAPIDPTIAPPVSGLSHNYTDDEVKKLRKDGINSLTQRPDGTIHAGPGGGVTLSGRSGKAAHEAAAIKALCDLVERNLKATLASGDLTAPITLRLEQRGTDTFALMDGKRGEIDLKRQLFVPPL